MASSGKKKTTMAKLARENKLRERRLNKQARKDARMASAERLDSPAEGLNATTAEGAQPAPEQADLDQVEERSTPTSRAPDHDMATENAIKHLFPKEAADAVELEPKQERKPASAAEIAVKADAGDKDFSLRRLREAPDEELALFEDRLRQDALAAGATEQELREAQAGQPGHG
jgi:hypothetical protein